MELVKVELKNVGGKVNMVAVVVLSNVPKNKKNIRTRWALRGKPVLNGLRQDSQLSVGGKYMVLTVVCCGSTLFAPACRLDKRQQLLIQE